MSFRGIIKGGEFLIGAAYSADLAARAEAHKSERPTITKGVFLTGGAYPAAELPVRKQAPLPKDLEVFADVIEAAGPLGVPTLDEIAQRLEEAGKKLAELRAKVKRR